MTEPVAVDHEQLRTSFGTAASSYERGRPAYPDDALDHALADLGVGRGSVVLDLAAGTGKLTRQLIDRGVDVVAVEPLEAMRAVLAESVPEARVIPGAAEAIPVDDASVDAVTVGQAFHWFDRAAALSEIARVLRPSGGLLAVWNEADERDANAKRLFTEMRTVGNRPETIEIDWRAVFDDSGRFEPARRARFRWVQELTKAAIPAMVESRSYVAVLEPAARVALLDRIAALIEPWSDPVRLPYITEVYWCRRISSPTSS